MVEAAELAVEEGKCEAEEGESSDLSRASLQQAVQSVVGMDVRCSWVSGV